MPIQIIRGMVTLWGLLFSTVVLAAAPDAKIVPVGRQKQLLVDDQVISSTENLTRVLGKVKKANDGKPLKFTRMLPDGRQVPIDAWPLFNTVRYDPTRGKFCLWHRLSFNDRSRRRSAGELSADAIGVGADYHRGYSESDDGLHFQFVALLEGLTSSGDTNLVVTDDLHETDPAHRYKIGYDAEGKVHAAALAHSADGIHWTPYNDEKPVTYRAADFPNQVYWDPEKETYRLLTRTDFGNGGGPFAGVVDVKIGDTTLEVRGVRTMTNPDLKADPTAWTLERHWLFDGEERIASDRPPIEELLKDPQYVQRLRREALRRQAYAMTDWVYEGVHFGLIAVFEWPTDMSEGAESDFITRHERSVENYYIITSRDGMSWDLHWVYAELPLVPRGPDGAWDKDMVFPTSEIITRGDRHWIYYGGNNERHSCAEKDIWLRRQGGVGLAHLRLDGFVALQAGQEVGTLITKPFKLEGRQLELNLDARGGYARVEILDAEANPIRGYSGEAAVTISDSDGLRLKPKWSDAGDLKSLGGRVVRLKIHLQNAKLYAFQVK